MAQAQAAFTEKTKEAAGEEARFRARSRGRKELDFAQELQLALEATDAVLRGRPPEEVLAEQRRRRQRAQELQAALADFRIYWDMMANSLMGRDLVLIDADKIKGQRNLFLFDADQLRMPMVLPAERTPAPQTPAGQDER
jgi:hypothetical protein